MGGKGPEKGGRLSSARARLGSAQSALAVSARLELTLLGLPRLGWAWPGLAQLSSPRPASAEVLVLGRPGLVPRFPRHPMFPEGQR